MTDLVVEIPRKAAARLARDGDYPGLRRLIANAGMETAAERRVAFDRYELNRAADGIAKKLLASPNPLSWPQLRLKIQENKENGADTGREALT